MCSHCKRTEQEDDHNNRRGTALKGCIKYGNSVMSGMECEQKQYFICLAITIWSHKGQHTHDLAGRAGLDGFGLAGRGCNKYRWLLPQALQIFANCFADCRHSHPHPNLLLNSKFNA